MEEKNEQTIVEEITREAANYFKCGPNCTECVVMSIMNHFETGLPKEAVALASGFGGGMGMTHNTCGAMTGAVMALSACIGRKNPLEKETVPERIKEIHALYEPVRRMVEEMKKQYGSLICSEICNPYPSMEAIERKRNCKQLIGYCAGVAAKYAEELEVPKKEQP